MNLRRALPWIIGVAALVLGLLAAYATLRTNEGNKSFEAVDITSVDWGKGFELTDHRGARRTLADFRGKVVMLFFAYMPAFHPTFLGLYADPETTARTVREFKAYFELRPPNERGAYTVDHSGQVYVFDPLGRLRLFIRPEASPESIARDVRTLLAKARG